jgi:tetratricopeptide (TPR) repeat protein
MADDRGAIEEANTFFQRGYEAQMAGRLEEAIEHYRRSIRIRPTAEAHTFLGWTFSFLGRHEDAIAECKVAISVDPEFGNPYNDIGAYLIELGRHEEAIPWLERAKVARRYEPRHFPYANLARVYVRQNRLVPALRELRAALDIEPGYEVAQRELARVGHLLHSLS